MKICQECLDDFLKSTGAQSRDGQALIKVAEMFGWKPKIVPPEQCEDSSHEMVKETEVKE